MSNARATVDLKDGYLTIPIYDKDGGFEGLSLISSNHYGKETDDSTIGKFRFHPNMDLEHIKRYYGIQYILTELSRHTGLEWRIRDDGVDQYGYTSALAVVYYEDNE